MEGDREEPREMEPGCPPASPGSFGGRPDCDWGWHVGTVKERGCDRLLNAHNGVRS